MDQGTLVCVSHSTRKLYLYERGSNLSLIKGGVSWVFYHFKLVKNGEIRPSHGYKIILQQREVRSQLNS